MKTLTFHFNVENDETHLGTFAFPTYYTWTMARTSEKYGAAISEFWGKTDLSICKNQTPEKNGPPYRTSAKSSTQT